MGRTNRSATGYRYQECRHQPVNSYLVTYPAHHTSATIKSQLPSNKKVAYRIFWKFAKVGRSPIPIMRKEWRQTPTLTNSRRRNGLSKTSTEQARDDLFILLRICGGLQASQEKLFPRL